MKYVLIVAHGNIALHFIQKAIEKYYNNNLYVVLYKDKTLLPEKIPNTFTFYKCDYTSHFRLNNFITKQDFSDAFIILDDEDESEEIYQYLRKHYKKIYITRSIYTLTKKHEEQLKADNNLTFFTEIDTLTSKLLSHLPNTPSIPHGFGLEQGEVMEISIPIGSIYANRQIHTIRQVHWKIIGIYRNNTFILATQQSIIYPGDILLIAGKPHITQIIYNQIKAQIGQFPAPFGRESCLIIDMLYQKEEEILHDCKEAIYLHRHLKSTKLTINILHATNFPLLQKIENFRQDDIYVVIDYDNLNFMQTIRKKTEEKIGLIIVGKEIFTKRSYRRALWESQIPVFKTAKRSLRPDNYDHTSNQTLFHNKKMIYPPNVSESLLVIAGDNQRDSDISTLIFDISKQLSLNIHIYDFDPDNHFNNEIEEEFGNLSRIFERKFTIERSNTSNPLFYIQKRQEPVLHFIPFNSAIARSRFYSFIHTQFEALAFMLDLNPQIFLPINEQQE